MKGIVTLILLFSIHIGFTQNIQRLTLEECINIASENSLNIRRAQLNLEGNKVNLMQSRASQLPNANLNWNYGFNWGRSIDPTTNQFIQQRINSSGVSGNSSVTLFNGLQQYNTVLQNRSFISASEADLSRAVNDVSLNVVTFYLSVIFNQELVENAKFQLESSNRQLERTKILVSSGAQPVTRELELVSQVASNEVSLINAENSLDLAMLNLKQVMLIPANQQIEVVIPTITLVEEPNMDVASQQIYEEAEKIQPEIQSADLNVEAATLGVKVAEGAASPTVSLGGGFNTNYSNAFDQRFIPDGTVITQTSNTDLTTASGEAIFENATIPGGRLDEFGYGNQLDANLSWNVGLGVAIPIFNGLRTKSNVQRSKIQLQQAEINAVEQRNFLRQQIESAYTDALAASKTYSASTRQVEALEETFRSIENQYNLGASNFTDYQVASNNLFQAKSDLVRAKYDFVFKKKILDFYQGKPLSFEQ